MAIYPINKEFFPFSILSNPVTNTDIAAYLGQQMRPPGWLWTDSSLFVRRQSILGYKGGLIEVIMMTPRTNPDTKNCLLYFHGGGFLFGGAPYHYQNAREYALRTPCKVLFVRYRLAPKHPFPYPPEDCYAALCWTLANKDSLGIDADRIAVGGDSAGGCLAAAVAQMARDRLGRTLCFQMLIYPYTNRHLVSDSNRRFVDTPMWNSRLSAKMIEAYLPDPKAPVIQYASPIEASDFSALPQAYIETAEFDCLHDDGIDYAVKLTSACVPVQLNETKGTMHGFDIVRYAPTTKACIASRVSFMQQAFA